MCTALTYNTNKFYFGRNLDYEYSYNEEVVITPRNYNFSWDSNYAIIGMAYIVDNYPLYYDGANECGLCIAGLNFVGYTKYQEERKDKINIAQYEFIPYVLSTCENVSEVKKKLNEICVVDRPFNQKLLTAELHYMIADEYECITVEFLKTGIMIYNNEIGVLTNNPPFDYQLLNLSNYNNLSNQANSKFINMNLNNYSRGLGSFGLPGDLSSLSRFVRASFVKLNSISNGNDVSQFFHILDSVSQKNGCCKVNDSYEKTIYTSCIDVKNGIYYYNCYNNHQINAVNLFNENLDDCCLKRYPLIKDENINYHN